MTSNITRRNALHLAAGAAALAAVPIAAFASAEPGLGPIGRPARERREIVAFMNGPGDHTDEEIEPLVDRMSQIDREIIATEANSIPEAVAALQDARDDFWTFTFEGREASTNDGDRLVLAALDNALRVLRPLA